MSRLLPQHAAPDTQRARPCVLGARVRPCDGPLHHLWKQSAAAPHRLSISPRCEHASARCVSEPLRAINITRSREPRRDCTGRAKGTLAVARSRDRRSRLRSVWRRLTSRVDLLLSSDRVVQRRLRIPEASARTVSRSDPRAEPPGTDPRRVRCDALRESSATRPLVGVRA